MYNVVICIPQRFNLADNRFWLSVCRMMKPEKWSIITCERKHDDDGRNWLVDKALKTDCTHLLFLDDDHIIQEDALIKALAFNKDILGGLYFDRQWPHHSNIFQIDDEGYLCKWCNVINKGLYQVSAVGTGFMLVKRTVFEKMSFPWFVWDENVNGIKVIDKNKEYIGCDVAFCIKAKNNGFNCYCDTDMIIKHIGDNKIIDENNCFRG